MLTADTAKPPVLVADDDPIMREMLKASLEAAGHNVETARDGDEALEKCLNGEARIVISDWEMPGMCGPELCQAIRQRSADRYVYFIMLTAHSGSDQIVEGMSAGADDFVVKPFNQAVLHARLRAGIRVLSLETHEMVIFALAKLAESRDSDTGQHLERVQLYARTLAEDLGRTEGPGTPCDPNFIRLVYQTSALHDIGKVGIPDNILLKSGRLTKAEFETMKRHTTIGADTLRAALTHSPNAEFLRVALDIAESHHERWDGSGYPNGKSGTDIPLAARIVAVADVYDALTTARAYKPAYSHETARDILIGESGKHFDPRVLDAFVRSEDDFIAIRDRFTTTEVENPLDEVWTTTPGAVTDEASRPGLQPKAQTPSGATTHPAPA